MFDSETMDADQVAAFLRADAETVRQFARSGDLPGTRIGKGWIFLKTDVLDFLRARIAADTARRRQRAADQTNHATKHPAAIFVTPRASRRRRAPIQLPELPHTDTSP